MQQSRNIAPVADVRPIKHWKVYIKQVPKQIQKAVDEGTKDKICGGVVPIVIDDKQRLEVGTENGRLSQSENNKVSRVTSRKRVSCDTQGIWVVLLCQIRGTGIQGSHSLGH